MYTVKNFGSTFGSIGESRILPKILDCIGPYYLELVGIWVNATQFFRE